MGQPFSHRLRAHSRLWTNWICIHICWQISPNKKLLARSVRCHFVGMGSDQSRYRVYIPENRSVLVTRVRDFQMQDHEQLPGVSHLLDGISRRTGLIEEDGMENDGEKEHLLAQAFFVHLPFGLPTSWSAHYAMSCNSIDGRVPRSFKEACRNQKWAEAIDREYKALLDRNTWVLVSRTRDMNVVPHTWVFRLKDLNSAGNSVLH